MPKPTLKPCPRCEHKKVIHVSYSDGREQSWGVQCDACKLTKFGDSWEEAESDWNNKVHPFKIPRKETPDAPDHDTAWIRGIAEEANATPGVLSESWGPPNA